METPKEYYYVYYSYEEWGRGYIGSRGCDCLPEEDVKYFGSYTDKTFHPTQKIILAIYKTREEALADEIVLHDFYDVANNPHFANRARATSTGFYYNLTKENASIIGKKGMETHKKMGLGIFSLTTEQLRENGKKTGSNHKKNKTGICGLSKEERIEAGKKGGKIVSEINRKNGTGIFGMTSEEKSKAGKKAHELGVGIHALTTEQRSENGRKYGSIGGKIGGKKNKENKTGICGLTFEERSRNGKISGKKSYEKCKNEGIGFFSLTPEEKRNVCSENAKRVNMQKWQCLETGFITNSGNLTKYQRARGIDTSKRIRLE